MAFAVGIDLGTTNTVIAVVREGVAATLHDPEQGRLLPSVVSFHPSGSVLVGDRALDRRLIDAPNTIYSIKRLIGRPWDSPEVREAREKLPFELREGQKGGTLVVARGDTFSLPEISAFVLRQAKAIAESVIGEPVERAVITVPANFNDLQRAATKMAGRLSGFDVLRILNEPTAAALAYGPGVKANERVAIYDFGGGTFDVTLLDVAPNVFEVLATAGDSALGGDDIDVVIAERMADDLLKKHRFDARANRMAFGRLRILGERMKRELSSREDFEIAVNDMVGGDRGATVTWRFRMTRPELEWASLGIVERTFKVCQQALEAAAITASDLDRVILVGGVTRMPMVARKVQQFFLRPPVVRINPDEVVALGAAIQAGLLDRSKPRSAESNAHPRIDESSIIAHSSAEAPEWVVPSELPIVQSPIRAEPGRGSSTPDLPIVQSVRAEPGRGSSSPNLPIVQSPIRAEPGRGSSSPDLPIVHSVRADAGRGQRNQAPSRTTSESSESLTARGAAGPSAPYAEFLPRIPSKPLVFDVPETKSPPAVDRSAPSLPPPRPRLPRALASPSAEPSPLAVPPIAPLAVPPIAPPRTAEPQPARAAAVVSQRPRAPLLIDVTPLTLNVETVGGFCDMLIDANTPVPCDRTRTFATASDGQTTVRVRIAQGESKRFSENTFLGELELTGLTAAARGEAQIAVTFEIDVDGILNVRARDVKTGSETGARIALVGAQTEPAEIQAMHNRQAAHPIERASARGAPATRA
jgi:molecular chaperone DnaK